MSDSDRTMSEAKETFRNLQEMSRLLHSGLDDETMAICVRLVEDGANPEALASIIRDMRGELPIEHEMQ